MKRNVWLTLSLIALISNVAQAGMVVTGADPTLNYTIVYKSMFQSNVATSTVNNLTFYYTNLEFDDSATLKNTISVNPYVNDITIAAGKTVTGTSNLFGDAAKSGSGTYTNSGGTLWASDPLFLSTSTPNFHLTGGSPARRAGTDVGLTTDYSGRPVKTPPSIGAYEFGASRVPIKIGGKWR